MSTPAAYMDSFFRAYVLCALWSSTDDEGEPLDFAYSADALTREARDSMRKDCADFIAARWKDLKDLNPEQCGHDFWLTRNGHGAGFWDRGLGPVGDRLSDAARVYSGVCLYVTAENQVGAE